VAQVNTAAVNYHFGTKDGLYVAALKYAFERSLNAYPPDGGAPPESPAEERLRARILSWLRRIADPEAYDIDLLHKEIANPTGLVDEVIEEAMGPIEQGFRSTAHQLLGPGANEKQVALCQMSVMTQCLDPMLRARLADTALASSDAVPSFRVEELAEHITRFSLAGICAIRERAATHQPHAATHQPDAARDHQASEKGRMGRASPHPRETKKHTAQKD
jgi:AcrR family transcriptional regulator